MRRPCVKPEHRPRRLPNGDIRIGGEIHGLAAEIEDPTGLAWQALQLMDGTRSLADILDQLPESAEIVQALLDSGHIEEAAPDPPDLTAAEQVRYARNVDYFRWADLTPRDTPWELQLRLKRARVLVLGLGGVGTHAARALAATGVGTLHCADPDVVEPSNLNRQLYGERDVGRGKAEATVEALRAVNSDIQVTGATTRIATPEDLFEAVEGFDVLALCADEPKGPDGIRHWANRAGIPWAGGGYTGPMVSVGVFAPGHPCYDCLLAEGERRGVHADHSWPGVLSTSAGLAGLMTAQAVISLITGVPDTEPGYAYGINLACPGDATFVRPTSRDECEICGLDRQLL
ncbi:HesA/MoeB/ThiF family protein [Nonomuraea sediminis]|uniref:HesA/MoeB/ThiF family protein n=1 Tax=Nonomuraea sediminis TaxID=2835864 RepID=UPI001BDD5187|nr:ThiF family adenylyltransferase [Nonomuraea sediminis]